MNSKKIPNILHMIWVGEKEPAEYFWVNLNKWKSLMPNWTYMIWTNDKLTTENIDESYLELINKSRNGAQAADLLGYYVIEKWGGYLLDADITPIKSLDELDIADHEVVLCNDLPTKWEYIASGFFGAIPNHQLFKNIIATAYYTDFNDKNQQISTGPGLLGKEVAKLDWNQIKNYLMLPHWMFYRNRIGDPDVYMPNRVMKDHPNAFGHHFYAATWI
jgi:mannosyltransferase OCH1-like enzyme